MCRLPALKASCASARSWEPSMKTACVWTTFRLRNQASADRKPFRFHSSSSGGRRTTSTAEFRWGERGCFAHTLLPCMLMCDRMQSWLQLGVLKGGGVSRLQGGILLSPLPPCSPSYSRSPVESAWRTLFCESPLLHLFSAELPGGRCGGFRGGRDRTARPRPPPSNHDPPAASPTAPRRQ